MEPEQVRNIMDSMIRKLYDMELEEQGRSDWQNGSIAEEGKRYLKEHFLLDISEYDVIIGYRADDSYFFFLHSGFPPFHVRFTSNAQQ